MSKTLRPTPELARWRAWHDAQLLELFGALLAGRSRQRGHLASSARPGMAPGDAVGPDR
jgi:hypothetical protein